MGKIIVCSYLKHDKNAFSDEKYKIIFSYYEKSIHWFYAHTNSDYKVA